MKRLGVCCAGLLVGLTGISMRAEAGVLGQTSRDAISISVTIAPHVVVNREPRQALVGVGDTATAMCIGSRGFSGYSATLLARINGRSEAIDLPLLHRSQLPAAQQICGREVGAGAAVLFDNRVLQAIRDSTEPATLLIIPD
jgi:hypothetical protein